MEYKCTEYIEPSVVVNKTFSKCHIMTFNGQNLDFSSHNWNYVNCGLTRSKIYGLCH